MCPHPRPWISTHPGHGYHLGSTTRQILALREHLVDEQVSLVVIEATGDYWKPFVRHEALWNRVEVR